MQSRASFMIFAILLIPLFTHAGPATAEWELGVFGGAAIPENDTLTIERQTMRLGVAEVEVLEMNESFKDSFSGGLRIGYWFQQVPWLGLSGGPSFFVPDGDLFVIPLTVQINARLPILPTPDYPQGRLKPYIAVGPALFVTLLNDEDSSLNLGFDGRLGLAFELPVATGARYRSTWFFEYRYTIHEFELTENIPNGSATSDGTIRAHHVLAGFSFRF